MNKLYVAYGSNLNLRQMKYRCPTAKVVGSSMLQDYELLFRGGLRSAVATVEPCKGGKVPVLVWDIKPRDEQALDVYEGWPSFYIKEKVKLELDGKPAEAMIYIMNDGHQLGTPSQSYYNTILEGYFTADFDRDILDNAVQESSIRCEEQQPQQDFWDMKFW